MLSKLVAAVVVAGGLGSCKPAPAPEREAAPGSAAVATRPAIDAAAPAIDALAAAPSTAGCTLLPFAATTPVPEASGAAWLVVDGQLGLVVNSDSGHDGAYAIVDPETGATREQGTLPLGEPGDDIEGLAARDDRVYGLTSAGWLRVWVRRGNGFALVDGPYAIGPVDRGKAADAMACDPHRANCAANYEGLCLVDRAHAAGPCAGFAASKRDGALYCLRERAGRFAVDRSRAIPITSAERLADCAFADDGTLWTGNNLIGFATVHRVDGWSDPAKASVTAIGPLGPGFPETLAVRGDVIYRMSDMGGDAPSMMTRHRCPR